MKKITLLMVLLLAIGFSYGQTLLAQFDFENPGGYSTSIPEFTDYMSPGTGTDGRDYFLRTDGSNTRAETYTNQQGLYYFAAQDIDGEGATLPVYLTIDNINISGYSNIEFRVYLAEDDQLNPSNLDWDASDYVHFNYDIDNTGTFSDLLWIENDGTTFNSAPFIDTDYDGTGDGTEITNDFSIFTQNILGTGNLLDIQVVFNLNNGEEDIAIDNIEIWGTLTPCNSAVTWNGSTWSNGAGPDINTAAIIDGSYNTATDGGSFSTCSLTVNSSGVPTEYVLNIANGDNVQVQNDIIANGNITVQSQGAVVQISDLATVAGSGTITVSKTTAPMNAWYEYTYWSSPVFEPQIGSALFESDVNRRFYFNAANFTDSTMETGNNNAADSGQDDIDDNGDDWQPVISGATVMQPGVGYASTHEDRFFIGPGSPPYQFNYTFEGPFNNGIIRVPIYRNDSELNDYNWNFIGNPYPSAIDADLFLAANSNVATNVSGTDNSGTAYINGAIFLWSQNTAPSGTANGNEQLNFSNDDYAIINATGQSAGGDGIIPNRFIPSGQGFFVSMVDPPASATLFSGDIYTSDIVFNNSMRVVDPSANSLFFKNSNSKKTKNTNAANKLWLDLTSDNGVFNQILIGYVNGATNEDDGIAYDTNKYPTKGAALYSAIENSDKKFAIQGKAPSDLNENEIVNLGFKTSIDVATLYTLSIAQLQGDFLNNNTVYLEDNLLGRTHNLSNSDYTFTSEVGEFNTRFKIVFTDKALSTDNISLHDNSLSIIELDDDHVNFKASNNVNIKSVAIYDLLGRQLYNLKGNNSSETYQLSNLKSTIFIAKVELSNGSIITKKAIKR